MQILRVVSLVAAAMTATPQVLRGPDVVAVRRVVDGNTITVALYGRVRLAGIRSATSSRRGGDGERLGRQARERLDGLVGHHFVRLEFPSAVTRAAAYAFLQDGTFVNALLVGEGLARVSGHPPGARGEELLLAQEQAREARLGIWSARNNSAIPQLPTPNSATPHLQPPTPC